VCKIIKVVPEISFARIIESYYALNVGREKLNHRIIRVIKIEGTKLENKRHGNVIDFYNIMFVPAMKSYLLELQKFDFMQMQQQIVKKEIKSIEDAAMVADMSTGAASMLNKLGSSRKRSSSDSSSSPNGVAGLFNSPVRVKNSNIYVSSSVSPDSQAYHLHGCGRLAAMRSNFLTPRTRALYNFGESSSNDLALINKTILFGVESLPQLSASKDHIQSPGEKSDDAMPSV